jgi:predicted RNA-binding Zn-ribbon protein involved in translation (DUF1610 family)
MSIQVACAGCGSQLRVNDNLLGKSFKCPKCGHVMRAEAPMADVLEEVESPPPEEELADEQPRPRRRRKSKFKRCPECGDKHAQRVLWTFWGSFYGPAIFAHVRCPSCGTTYNGRSGRSNLLPAIIFMTGTLVLFFIGLGVIGWMLYVWWDRTKARAENIPVPALHAQYLVSAKLLSPLGVQSLTEHASCSLPPVAPSFPAN